MHIITTHKNTDFDALASTIAATLYYPGAVGVIPSETNRNVDQFLSTHKTAFNLISPKEVDFNAVSELTVVDTNQWHRLDRMEKLKLREDLPINLWDHHMTTPGDIEADWKYQEQIGATITLFIREMMRKEMQLSSLDATIMLLGLYEDTGHLTFPSTTADDARAAAFLLENGADLNLAHFFLNPPYGKAQQEALFSMMRHTERIKIHGLTIGFNILKIDYKVPEVASVVQLCLRLMGVDAIFVFLDLGDRHTIVGRSSTPKVNIGNIMKIFGGGGHPGAGSASMKDSENTPQDIRIKIEHFLKDTLKNGITIGDLMSSPVISIPPETPMYRAQEIMDKKKIRGLLVMEEEEIKGIIVLWDLKRVKKRQHWKSPVKAFMSRNVKTVTPEMPLAEVTKIFMGKEAGFLPVVAEKKVMGVVTRTDLLAYYYGLHLS